MSPWHPLLTSSNGRQECPEIFPHGCQRRRWSPGATEAGHLSSVGAACGVTVPRSLHPPAEGGGHSALGPSSLVTSSSMLSLALRFQLPEAPGAESLGVTATVLGMASLCLSGQPLTQEAVLLSDATLQEWRCSGREDGTTLGIKGGQLALKWCRLADLCFNLETSKRNRRIQPSVSSACLP